MLLFACWMAIPKLHVSSLAVTNSSSLDLKNETELKSQATEDGNVEEYKKPVYFNIFKLIFSFLPVKSNQEE